MSVDSVFEWSGGLIMTELLTVLTTIAFLDSTSMIPMALVALITLMAGPRPLLSSIAFLAGIYLTYFACGVLIFLGLDSVIDVLNQWFVEFMNHPDTTDLYIQIAIGALLLFLAIRMTRTGKPVRKERTPQKTSPFAAFTFGGGLIIVGMPGAVPYFAAVDQILRADPSTTTGILLFLYYNAVFILPLALIVVIRAVMGERGDAVMARLQQFLGKWGVRIVMIALFLLGTAMLADGIGWLLGRSFIPID
jgi:cytochrome c biogenesis protein CcdA